MFLFRVILVQDTTEAVCTVSLTLLSFGTDKLHIDNGLLFRCWFCTANNICRLLCGGRTDIYGQSFVRCGTLSLQDVSPAGCDCRMVNRKRYLRRSLNVHTYRSGLSLLEQVVTVLKTISWHKRQDLSFQCIEVHNNISGYLPVSSQVPRGVAILVQYLVSTVGAVCNPQLRLLILVGCYQGLGSWVDEGSVEAC